MRLSDEDLAKIIQRDAMAGALWFIGPASFTALAARDRRIAHEEELASLPTVIATLNDACLAYQRAVLTKEV